MTAGETAISDIYKFALSYYDARAKEIGLPKTDGIYIHEGPVGNDDNDHDFVVEHSFFVGNDEDYYVTNLEDLMDEVLSLHYPMNEEYKGNNRYRMVSVITKRP